MKITSPVFEPGGLIPPKYTCEGLDENPPLVIRNIPNAAKSLSIIVEDQNVTHGTFDHWIVWNIPVKEDIKENMVPGLEGMNSLGGKGYKGPCPVSGTHHYFFRIFALDTILELKEGASRKEVEEAMSKHIIASGKLVGLYKKMSEREEEEEEKKLN